MSTTSINTSVKNHTKALLLGSGELGKEVAIELLRMGVYVIACDRYDNAPAMQVAQERHVFNMKDRDELKAVLDKVKPDFVIPEIEAIATDLLVELEEKEGLHVVPSAKAAHTTMNRESIRNLAAKELQVKTSPYFFASTIEEIYDHIDEVGFPCFIKPIMSSSGKGQSKVDSREDLEKAFLYAIENGRGHEKRVIVEGMVKFDREITLLTVNACDGIHFCKAIGHRQENGDYRESWQPAQIGLSVEEKAKEVAAKVVTALGGYGIFGVELFICGDEVIFSEVSPRPHDTGMVTMISQDLSEFALHVRALLGLPVGNINFISPSASAAVVCQGHGDEIIFNNLDKALALAKNTEIRIFGKPDIDGERRLAVVLNRAQNVSDAVNNAKLVRNQIEVEIK